MVWDVGRERASDGWVARAGPVGTRCGCADATRDAERVRLRVSETLSLPSLATAGF
jgi:hypothetical protein